MKEAWDLFLHGGFVMWPLLVALIIAVMIAIERIAYYQRLKKEMFSINDALENSKFSWNTLITLLGEKDTSNISYDLSRVLDQCQNRDILQSKMENMVAHVYTHATRGLDWLSTIITMAPLLGLLGTVTGMIGAFQVFGADGAVPTAITGGVGEALVATASGLCVAIIALCFHAAFSHHVRMMIARLEDSFSRVLDSYDRGHAI